VRRIPSLMMVSAVVGSVSAYVAISVGGTGNAIEVAGIWLAALVGGSMAPCARTLQVRPPVVHARVERPRPPSW
jgi:hypothetical protein